MDPAGWQERGSSGEGKEKTTTLDLKPTGKKLTLEFKPLQLQLTRHRGELEWQYHEDPYQRLPLGGQSLLLRLTLLLLMLFSPYTLSLHGERAGRDYLIPFRLPLCLLLLHNALSKTQVSEWKKPSCPLFFPPIARGLALGKATFDPKYVNSESTKSPMKGPSSPLPFPLSWKQAKVSPWQGPAISLLEALSL